MTTPSIIDFFIAYAYVGVGLAMIVDGIGLPFPGRLILVAAGALAAVGDLDLLGVIGSAALGALLGDHVWYVAGRLGGDGLLGVLCRLAPKRQACIARAREYVARFGAPAFIVGRFVGGVRILAAPVAASAGIGYARFLLFDLVGAVVWAGTFVLLGYFVGSQWPLVMERLGLPGSLAIGGAITTTILAVLFVARRLSRSPRDVPRPARGRRPRRAT